MKTKLYTLLGTILIGITFYIAGLANEPIELVYAQSQAVEEIVSEEAASPAESISQPSMNEEISAYILKVFGKDTEKAYLVLRGSDGCGGENGSLNPDAVNTNKDGSKDYNIFQVNDKFHPVYQLNLDTDWKANIDYSYRMFQHDGYTFAKRWSAGKCLGRKGFNV